MLPNATIAKLEGLGLGAMAAALADQLVTPGPWAELSFEDRLGLLVDREADARDSRRLAARLKAAKLRYPAAVEDLDFRSPRGLNRATVLGLAQGSWVTHHHNLVVTGPTGVGKSFLACALANAALRQGHTASYARMPRLVDDLALGRADGRYARLLGQLGRVSLLVLDDFLLTPAPVAACRDPLEVIEDRAQRRSTLVVSQLPVEKWHRRWPTRPWPRPSSTASCTRRTASRSRGRRFASASPRLPRGLTRERSHNLSDEGGGNELHDPLNVIGVVLARVRFRIGTGVRFQPERVSGITGMRSLPRPLLRLRRVRPAGPAPRRRLLLSPEEQAPAAAGQLPQDLRGPAVPRLLLGGRGHPLGRRPTRQERQEQPGRHPLVPGGSSRRRDDLRHPRQPVRAQGPEDPRLVRQEQLA